MEWCELHYEVLKKIVLVERMRAEVYVVAAVRASVPLETNEMAELSRKSTWPMCLVLTVVMSIAN